MKIDVDLFATLADYLPGERRGSRAVIDVPDGSTVADLARSLGIPPELPWIALVNGHEADAEHHLFAADVVTMFPPLAGGQASPSPGRRQHFLSGTTSRSLP